MMNPSADNHVPNQQSPRPSNDLTRLLSITGAFAFFALSFYAWGRPTFATAPTADKVERVERHIDVEAQAQLDISPNIVYLTMTLNSQQPTPKEAAAKLELRKNKLVAAFTKAGFPIKRLTMSHMTLSPRYKRYPKNHEYKHFEANVTLVACIHKLSKLTDYIQLAAENNVNHLSTRFFNDQFIKHRKTLRDMALKSAREKAEQMAKAAGVSIGVVRTIKETQGYRSYSSFSNAYGGSRRSTSARVQPGAIPMRLTVRVTYTLR